MCGFRVQIPPSILPLARDTSAQDVVAFYFPPSFILLSKPPSTNAIQSRERHAYGLGPEMLPEMLDAALKMLPKS